MWRQRTAIARRYDAAFGARPELETPHDRSDCQHAWHLYMLRLNLDHLSIDRAQFMEELKERRIGASVHFIPLHCHPYYRDTYHFLPQDLPTSYAQYLREVSLPIYSRMNDEDVEDVISAVLDIVDSYHV
jgi:dTDP-4-amino-4,6-dideoxygalactose transaminase